MKLENIIKAAWLQGYNKAVGIPNAKTREEYITHNEVQKVIGEFISKDELKSTLMSLRKEASKADEMLELLDKITRNATIKEIIKVLDI